MNSVQDVLRFWSENISLQGLCMCLTGSLARNETSVWSDNDILLLTEEDEGEKLEQSRFVREVQSVVPRSSVVFRSVYSAPRLFNDDIRSWLALLDSRYVAGNENLYFTLWNNLAEQSGRHYKTIFEKIKEITLERHIYYGSSTLLLEPNIKNSAGALRDILAISYLEVLHLLRSNEQALTGVDDWASLIENSSLRPGRRKAVLEARTFFLAVRNRMHEEKGHLYDTLKFEFQPVLAAAFFDDAYQESGKKVEHFMRRYYQHARNVNLALELSMYDHEPQVSGSDASSTEAVIHLPANGCSNIAEIWSMFLDVATKGKRIGSDVIRLLTGEDLLWQDRPDFGRVFDRIMKSASGVGRAIRSMHEYGVLKKVFPEFGTVEFFFQHNRYHFYTLDEHILIMLERAEALREDASIFGEVYRSLNDVSILFYAVLLHDIAKPVDVARHEIEGARMVPDIMKRYGRLDAIDDVVFLVRWHLAMEQIAFRRDIRDEETLQSFVNLVKTQERLNLLLLLTYADMAALNPRILTEWKKEMLLDLYQAASQRLQGSNTDAWSSNHMHLDASASEGLDEVASFRAIEDVREGEPVRVFAVQHRAFTEITVFCLDRPLLLSQLSAALLGADVRVLDASIDTRQGVAVDMFRVTDIVQHSCLDEAGLKRVRDMLYHVCTAEVTAEQLFLTFRRKWRRKIRRTVMDSVKTDVVYLDSESRFAGDRTIIEVYAPDSFGLLYVLCREISSFGLNIVFAKIATRVDGVVDSFYVREASGRPFTDTLRREQLRQSLLRHIKDVSHAE
jgi:[protein-PII] uridylyltransferase